jgi:hypothetical protein
LLLLWLERGEERFMEGEKSATVKKIKLSRLMNGALFGIGFLLSPLSWWNDLFVNIPIAYVIAQVFNLLDHRLFIVSFVGAYWATNVLGFLLMHIGGESLFRKVPPQKIRWRYFIMASTGYTLLIFLLAQIGFVKSPMAFLKQFLP